MLAPAAPTRRTAPALARVALALLLSAATTVAVSWSAAAWSSTFHRPLIEGRLTSPTVEIAFGLRESASAGAMYWSAWEGDFPGASARTGAPPPPWSILNNFAAAHALYLEAQDPDFLPHGRLQVWELASGWPCPAMVVRLRDRNCATVGIQPKPGPPYVVLPFSAGGANAWSGLGGGIELPIRSIREPRAVIHEARALPLRIWWPGFAINTLLALPLWLPIVFAGSIRRALRTLRGLCPRCGYNRKGLVEATRCPECGESMKADTPPVPTAS